MASASFSTGCAQGTNVDTAAAPGTSDAGDAQPDSAPDETGRDGAGGAAGGSSDGGDAADVADTMVADTAVEGGTPGPCGGLRCRDDQACSMGKCTFSCTGKKVPGDYASLQEAFAGLAAIGGTICLAAKTYPETTSVSPAKDLTVVGVSADSSLVTSVRISKGGGSVTLRGIGFTNGVAIESANVTLVGSRLRSTTSKGALYVQVVPSELFEVKVDGCDLQATSPRPAVLVEDLEYGGWRLAVTNSYVHDSFTGIGLSQSAPLGSRMIVDLVNDTIVRNTFGLESARAGGGAGTVTLTYFNDVFSGNKTGARVYKGTATAVHRNNAFFGNATDYAEGASAGPGYIGADPLLDDTVEPPAPKAASPLRGAGDATGAPTVDFWGKARGAKIDIGAVQG